MYKLLLETHLFKGLTEKEIFGIFENTHYNKIKFGKDDMIAQAGEQVLGVYLLLSGRVKTEIVNELGKSFVVQDFNCSCVLAPAFIFGETNKYPVNVVAADETELIFITKASFLRLIQQNETLLTNFLEILSVKTQFLIQKLKASFMLSIEGKVARFLLEKAKKAGDNEFVIHESHQDLADRFGVARPSVSRVISSMTAKGIIAHDRRKIKIKDRDTLIKCSRLI